MSELEQHAAHARAMATAQHQPTCEGHMPSKWGWARTVRPDPDCPGCVSDADRALWARLADEIEAYLGDDEQEGLPL